MHFLHVCFSFWMMPALVLKKMVMGNFERGLVDPDIADSIDFMVESVSMTKVIGVKLLEVQFKEGSCKK